MSTHSITPETMALVRSSWQRLRGIHDEAAALFYRRLFEIDPSLTHLFHGDMVEQGRMLMAMIEVAVSRLDRLGDIAPAIEALGRRHAQYGVEPEHYDTVGTALLDTLRARLGDAWTPPTAAAWATTYGTLAAAMMRASAETPRRAVGE